MKIENSKLKINKILVLGSGALKIGEAGEFDYSGSQAIKALKEEGIKTILVNPNIATIQTSKELADTIYFLPVNAYFVERVIKKERPDGILLSFGGQTALNCGLELNDRGILKKYKVEILGSPISAIEISEDRRKFAKHLGSINVPTPVSKSAGNVREALKIAKRINYPVMVRSGFALGGQGSGIAENDAELKKILDKAFSFTPQVLIEKYLHHFKEVEYEVIRDKFDNCVTVCNMENMDPLGIHTGESIVIAPSQTLTNFEYHTLRSISIKIVRSLGIVGECNVQFALNPNPKNGNIEYFVIELNARLSRSSALASKATGYPLAYVAAKLALGKNLTKLTNKITGATQFCFEPALDYVTIKIPRWDTEKFKNADPGIGSSMKSVGEIMGIGRTFEEAYQKGIRMLDLNFEGAVSRDLFENVSLSSIKSSLKNPTPERFFAVSEAFYRNLTSREIYKLTGIDPWFLYRIKNIVDSEKWVLANKKSALVKKSLLNLKQLGFSDKRIGELTDKKDLEIRKTRKRLEVLPSVLQIDTLAAEFPAKTNYLYLSYNASHNDVEASGKKAVMVLGSGPYRIGSSVEFDWTSVAAVKALKKHNKESIVVNCNPETVSTDYDISDKLYFEELTFERITDIYEFEGPFGVVVSAGGQTPNNRAKRLSEYGVSIIGTTPGNIERAENRTKFSGLLDKLEIDQPAWDKLTNSHQAIKFSEKVGYPVLVRPSFVLSGSHMKIIYTEEELRGYFKKISIVSREYPVTISKFIEDAKEIEIDAVAQNGKIKVIAVSEHVENAGVHSGDATIIFPSQKVYVETLKKLKLIAEGLAKELSITGPFNIQCLAKDNKVSVIEINLRSSRTFPFISKISGVNFMDISVDAFFGIARETIINTMNFDFVAVKAAQFSFSRLTGADPVLDVEMTSTGEVACLGRNLEEAFLKAELSVGGRIPKKGIFVSLGGEMNKVRFLEAAAGLIKLALPVFATEKTSKFLNESDLKTIPLFKIYENKSPNILEFFQKGSVDLAINITDHSFKKEINDDYILRRSAIDHNIPLFTNLKKAELFIKSVSSKSLDDLEIKSLNDYKI